jgi:hypothetical protein
MDFKLTSKEKSDTQKRINMYKEQLKNKEMSERNVKDFKSSIMKEIYRACGNLSITSFGFEANYQKSTKSDMNRIRYTIGFAYETRNFFGIPKSEIDSACKFAQKVVANTKERFKLNHVAYVKSDSL